MQGEIERMVRDFEAGRLNRRQLLTHLTAVMAAAVAAAPAASRAQESASTFQATGLNHIALNVTDVQSSRDFYVQHLGLEVARESRGSCFLNCGDNFVALFRAAEAGMNHYCYSVVDYDVSDAAEKLRAQDLEPRIEGSRIYFKDAEGLTVQLASSRHRP